MTAIPGRQNDEEQVRHPIVLKRILAPTDLTPDGKKAVDYAVALAEHFGARLTLLHVYRAPGANDYERMLNDYSVADQFEENAQIALDSFWSEIRKECPKADARLRCGVPAEEIVAAAKDLKVDLIVLSTHNYHWFSHLVDGSDAEQVLRHAPCPLLIVRKEERDFVWLEER
jgi:universal stress protein A